MNSEKITLSFSKTIKLKQLKPSLIVENHSLTNETSKPESIALFDSSLKRLVKQKEQVIPMIDKERNLITNALKNRIIEKDTQNSTSKKPEETKDLTVSQCESVTLEEKAAAELLKESQKVNEQWKDRDNESIEIKYYSSTFRNDTTYQNTLGEEPSLDNFEQIEVESFGKAMLRGMGWKKGQGIGKKNKKDINIIEPTLRSFSVGGKKNDTKNEDQKSVEGEILSVGCHALIHSGRNRGTYGIIKVIDEDHIIVESARNSTAIREVEVNVKRVSSKEFKDMSRVLNKDMYDEYKAKEEHKREKNRKGDKGESNDIKEKNSHKDKNRGDSSTERSLSSKDKHKGDSSTERSLSSKDKHKGGAHNEHSRETNDEFRSPILSNSSKKHSNRSKYDKSDARENHSSHQSENKKHLSDKKNNYKSAEKNYRKEERIKAYKKKEQIPWARENLKVRIISKDYKDGRYYKEKVIVKMVETVKSCICESERGKLLYDVDPNCLETVIPKQPQALVMVLKGAFQGQKAQILSLHQDFEKATVQLLEDDSEVFKMHYEDLCEYVGR